MVRAFVVGNFALGLLLSAVSTLFFWWIRLPYPLLIGPLSSFLSLIPYIGLPLGCLPPLVAALAIYDRLAPYILILAVVAALHVITVNLLYPKIVGPRVHLNPLVVTIALMFWSALWGAPGLKAVCDNVVKLQPFGRLMGN
jgi:predicted PurR-regulated permease PerM